MQSGRASLPDSVLRPVALELWDSPWLIPHMLSLDAVAVALAWQALLAVHTAVPLEFAERLLLGLTVWLIYLGDRLLDTRKAETPPLTARHRLLWRCRPLAELMLVSIGIADLYLTVAVAPLSLWEGGLLLTFAVVWYLAVAQLSPGIRGLPKAILVGLLFVAGTFLVAWTELPHPLSSLWGPGAAFFGLCESNLLLIGLWEGDEMHPPIRNQCRRLFPAGVALLAVVCAGIAQPWYRAVALAAVLLLILYAAGRRVSLDARRALADAALLTPLVFLVQ